MRTAEQWLDDPGEQPAWIDDPAAIVRRIQQEAFLAGATAQRDAFVRLAPVIAAQMPCVPIGADVACAIARGVNPEDVAWRFWGTWKDPEPPDDHGDEPDPCVRCNGTGEIDWGDDVESCLIDCPDCAGRGQ